MAITRDLELILRRLINKGELADELVNAIDNAGHSGGAFWRLPVVALDSMSTTLPTSGPVTIDGITIVNSDRVLYTNLTSSALNNRVYKIKGFEGQLSVSLEIDSHPGDGAPSDGDTVYIEGINEPYKITVYDNDTIKYLPFV